MQISPGTIHIAPKIQNSVFFSQMEAVAEGGVNQPDNFIDEDESSAKTTSDPDEHQSKDADLRMTVALETCHKLGDLSEKLTKICKDSDPKFVQIGRDLSIVTKDAKRLTDTVLHAANLIKNENDQEGNSSLKKTESLVQDVFTLLSEERDVIDEDSTQVTNLVTQIFQCARIKEMIDRINSLFRIVRINIRIQCSARGLNDEMFVGVSEDLEHLSKTLHQVTKQVMRDINQGAKSLTKLQKSIIEHLKHIDNVFEKTKRIVSNAFHDIRQLMDATETMIQEADSRSKKVSEKVNEVVVSIQFHDSLSQRVEHIVKAFEDITGLCATENDVITEEHLGTAYIIIELQLRQLAQINEEIKLVRERIENDFLAIESEVEGMGNILHDNQYKGVGPQEFLSAIFISLEDTLIKLKNMLAEAGNMVREIDDTAGETKEISGNLLQLKENITEIREETRVQAVNTIIMASALGQQGKTIEVLAKEIQTLSGQSSVLADDVEAMHLAVNQTIEELMSKRTINNNQIDGESLTRETETIKKSFNEILNVVNELTEHIQVSGSRIKHTRSALVFLDLLGSKLDKIIIDMNETLSSLEAWEGKGSREGEEIEQLIQRYSMEQERMIHMFDRAEEVSSEDEDDIFF